MTIICKDGFLVGAVRVSDNFEDGVYNVDTTTSRIRMAEGHTETMKCPTMPIKYVFNLNVPNAFVEAVGFIASLRTSGELTILDAEKQTVFLVNAGNLVSINTTGQSTNENNLRQHALSAIERHLVPRPATMLWSDTARSLEFNADSEPLEFLLLESLRLSDENRHLQSELFDTLPRGSRLSIPLTTAVNHSVLQALRVQLGAPPYYVHELSTREIPIETLTLLGTALDENLLVVERENQTTAPPSSLDVTHPLRFALQSVIARFNHILRRLNVYADLDAAARTRRLQIFRQHYGFESLLANASHLPDGALDPTPLIDNVLNEASSARSPVLYLSEALHEFAFFELSALREIAPSDRRALMAMTSDLACALQKQEHSNVA